MNELLEKLRKDMKRDYIKELGYSIRIRKLVKKYPLYKALMRNFRLNKEKK